MQHKFIIWFLLVLFAPVQLLAFDDEIKFPKAEFLNDFSVRIPIQLVDHLMVIEAEIEGKNGNFIIDTGAQTLILNKVHFPNVRPHNKKKEQPSGVLELIDDPLVKRLNQFNIRHFSLKNKHSDVIDLSHIEETKKIHLLGIIGYDILKDYELFVDLHLNQITLTKTDSKGNPLSDKVYAEKIVDSVDFYLKNHTIVLNGFVEDQKVRFGLDTGAEFNQLNKSVNKSIIKHFQPKKRLKLVGASNRKIEVLAGNLHRVKLSDTQYFGPMKTVLTNLRKMNQAFGTKLDGVLGYEFFKYKRTIINYKKRTLYFINYPLKRS